MKTEFLDLIKDYQSNNNLNDSIRIYILNHLFSEKDILSYMDLFAKTSKECEDKVGYALSQAMYFWYYHGNDIERAHDYNKISLDLYHQIDDYQNKVGYLTVLNNEIIYNNYAGSLHKSYSLISEGMTISELNKNINYYFAFSVNCYYLLLDICLFDKAYEILNKIEANNVTLIPSNTAIMKSLKTKVYYNLKKYDECLKEALDLQKYNQQEHILDDYIIYAHLLEAYIKTDIVQAEKFVELLLKEIISNDGVKDNIDINEAYLALARYYKAKGDNLNSFKWYKEVYLKYENLLGCKLNALNEVIDSFKDNDSDLYFKAVLSKEKHLEEINRTLIVVSKQDKKIYDAFADFRYKFLYQKMEELTNFIKEINNLNTYDKIDELINSSLKEILNANFVETFIGKKDYKYHGLDLSNIDKENVYEEELSPELKRQCNSLTCIVIHDTNLDSYLYIVIGLKVMDNIEKKENTYMISLIKQVLTPVLLQIERYNKALDNYSHDQLTMLYNRYGLDYIIQENFKKSSSLYLLMMDIDDFKKINDVYGHDVGDSILKAVSEALSITLGSENIARIGGEEFIGLVSSNVPSLNDILDELMNNIRKIKINDQIVTISLGSSLMTSIDDFKRAKIEADKKLYIAKQNGKNRYVI